VLCVDAPASKYIGHPYRKSTVTATMPSSSGLGAGDQACNECKRRKGRCDRQLPECGPCARNKRHCLYESHSKTPLTRRYLTEVEARLRQTQSRLREAEQRATLAESKLLETQVPNPATGLPTAYGGQGEDTLDFAASQTPAENGLTPDLFSADQTTFASDGAAQSLWPGPQANATQDGVSTTQSQVPELEQPPSGIEDFSWDEQSVSDADVATASSTDADGASVTDGMASLAVEDAGYLGVASGAAMLKLLMPAATPGKRRQAARPSTGRGMHSVTSQHQGQYLGWIPTPVWQERRIQEIDIDAAINAYFSLYHISYPIVHEPTFRAQYAQVLPRPSGRSWNALAYIIAALGLFTSATEPTTRDLDLFEAAKSNMSIDSLETGNLTLVQALSLMSNYIQKRGKPNSGYNYLGIALHMAMTLGLHKEFLDWQIQPLQLEIRRRVWWALYNFYVGAAITFGRPLAWPANGIEIALPLNVNDRELTNVSVALPQPQPGLTTHSAVAAQARFHMATNDIYARVISMPFPSAQELVQLDDERITPWYLIWADEDFQWDPRFTFSRSVMEWRYRNLRIIMYRPFVIREVLSARVHSSQVGSTDPTAEIAVTRCLLEAKMTIASINMYWNNNSRNVLASWYALYFLFQASMIPCVCLRNDPGSEGARDWREQLVTALQIMQSMFAINPSSRECHATITQLCADYLYRSGGSSTSPTMSNLGPVKESPTTQIEGLYTMMWPDANVAEMDMLIEDDTWNNFITDFPSRSPPMFDPTFDDSHWT